jgi:hypothetical protein
VPSPRAITITTISASSKCSAMSEHELAAPVAAAATGALSRRIARVGGDHHCDHQGVAEGDGDCAAGRVVVGRIHASRPRGRIRRWGTQRPCYTRPTNNEGQRNRRSASTQNADFKMQSRILFCITISRPPPLW